MLTLNRRGSLKNGPRIAANVVDGTLTSTNKELPNPAEIDFLIVLGGPQSPLRMNDYH
jgi:hypothetical protein